MQAPGTPWTHEEPERRRRAGRGPSRGFLIVIALVLIGGGVANAEVRGWSWSDYRDVLDVAVPRSQAVERADGPLPEPMLTAPELEIDELGLSYLVPEPMPLIRASQTDSASWRVEELDDLVLPRPEASSPGEQVPVVTQDIATYRSSAGDAPRVAILGRLAEPEKVLTKKDRIGVKAARRFVLDVVDRFGVDPRRLAIVEEDDRTGSIVGVSTVRVRWWLVPKGYEPNDWWLGLTSLGGSATLSADADDPGVVEVEMSFDTATVKILDPKHYRTNQMRTASETFDEYLNGAFDLAFPQGSRPDQPLLPDSYNSASMAMVCFDGPEGSDACGASRASMRGNLTPAWVFHGLRSVLILPALEDAYGAWSLGAGTGGWTPSEAAWVSIAFDLYPKP